MGRRKKTNLIKELFNPEDTMSQSFAMTTEFAGVQLNDETLSKWGLQHKQLFACILSAVDWENTGNNCRIELNNRDVAKIMGWNYSEEEERKIAYEIEKLVDFMRKNSEISLRDPYNYQYYKGSLIYAISGNPNYTTVRLNPDFMNHFEGLYRLKRSFPALMSTDTGSFRYSASYDMYMNLKLKGKADGSINKMEYTMTQLREALKVAPESYMKKVVNSETGEIKKKYDRTNLVKKAFLPVLEDINNSEVIEIIPAKDGKLYHTIKEGGKTSKYIIKYKVHTIREVEANREKKWNRIIDANEES